MDSYRPIRELIDRVRRRWRTLQAFGAIFRASLAAIDVVGIALTAALWTAGRPGALAAIGFVAGQLTAAAVVRGRLPVGPAPPGRSSARIIEERHPARGERLVGADA